MQHPEHFVGKRQSELILADHHILQEVKRGPMLLIFGMLAVVLLGTHFLSQLAFHPPKRAGDMTLELGPMPLVEPVTIKPVPPELARTTNAQIPVSAAPIPAAKPFRLGAGGIDAGKAIDCLAATIYYEAANEPLNGQLAVAQVVLNRVRHPAFPKTVCGVVFQGSERKTGCQFSFTCDGSMASRKPSPSMWDRMKGIAATMLAGHVYAPVGNATHYHADYVVPYWSAQMEKVRIEGAHIFYRWAGGWGSPRAFVGRYAGSEQGLTRPRPDAPSSLTLPALPIETKPLAASVVAKAVATGATTAADIERGQFILRADPALDPAQLPILAQQACGDRDYCKVLAWSDPKKMPKGFPIPEVQLGSMSFSYLRIKAQGFEKPLWNCSIFPRADKKQCIKERVVVEQPLPSKKAVEQSPTEPQSSNQTDTIGTTNAPNAFRI